MDKMKELYGKVAGDGALQAKYAEIMNEAETAGKEETGKKLIAFAKEAGYEIAVEEISDFFSKLETKKGALSEEELDAVAGGKLPGDQFRPIFTTTQGCDDIAITTLDFNHSQCRFKF